MTRPFRLRTRLAAAVPLALWGCGGGDEPRTGIPIPALGTALAVAGNGPAGEPLDPRFLARLRLDTVERFTPQPLPGSVVDAFIGGLEPRDFPSGLTLETLAVVSADEDGARPFPSLRSPHVVARTGTADELADFVPVDSMFLSEAESLARRDRLDRMLEGVAVRPPCTGSVDAFTVSTPRIPAESFLASRADASGGVLLGLVASGTAAIAAFSPGSTTPTLLGIGVPDPLLIEGQRASIRQIGPLTEPGGRPLFVVLGISGAFDQTGLLLRWSSRRRRYEDDTPLVPGAPVLNLRGRAVLQGAGEPEVCTFGTIRGGVRDGGLWCRTETSTTWRLEHRVPESQTLTGAYSSGDGTWVVVDRSGAVHARIAGLWRTVSEPGVNVGCRPACSPFDLAVRASTPTVVIGGASAQLLRLTLTSPALLPEPVEALSSLLFRDEREGGSRALSMVSAAPAPDGRWWIGTARGTLIRGTADLQSLERICLPREASGAAITAIAHGSDGRMVLGLASGSVMFGRWD